ncbi:Pr6Pr family membrane protein [Amycolatopsis sp. OK19-0408]|uniref:Pr6Pr family membrane protein n=1 Tax=Amycolatopsis iheyensis TaxID=2945988 RepID=A0A9X2NPZ4_9PSEU|nr:Pr6Pr family membrane protein [Amycolatopsis iheyensis]MCR6489870.1 Pr6Pr family membrane protein [Amycolatopsis iheyensis]
MHGSKLTRVWFGVTTLVALTGLVTQVIATAGDTTGQFRTAAGRIANLFCYFTIDSNLLVTVTSALVALGLARGGLFRVLWLDALVGIIVTGIVYQVALEGLYELHGLSLFSDTMLHKVTPLLFVAGWVVAGPRHAPAWRTVWWSLVYPLAWLAFTLPRGAITGFYPYPFVDAAALGYGQVTLNCVGIGLFFVALAAIAFLYDRASHRRATQAAEAAELA